ncbi:MAG: halocarboxylic acid dehydrogenase DehI family protein [Terriglobales bacterium]
MLSRLWEEDEVAPELARLYGDIRSSFDLPFVPSLFKQLAAIPHYLQGMWNDLGPVVRSREFQTADRALEEFTRSLAIAGGWRFSDQQRVLAGQKFSNNNIEQLSAIAAIFTRAATRMGLFARLLQKGYSGGQPGRISSGRQAPALARMITVHVPRESDASLRVWLIYSDIRRTLGVKNVPSSLRVLSPFPAYLASVWLDTKKVMADPAFLRARDDVAKRALGLLVGIPVKDHRALARQLDPKQWREIEEAVDAFARLSPQRLLALAIWQRSFAVAGRIAAA